VNDLVNILSTFIFNQLTAELEKQGHKLSGALIESFETKVKEVTEDNLTIEFLMLNYGLSLNDGIKPKNIPYTIGGPRRGGTSKYIEGLIRFAKQRFQADQKRATQIAFAIARKQKEEGYPLTGKIGFIDNVLLADEKQIQEIIETHFEVTIQLLFTEFLQIKS
jgi:hypothetical protein